MKLISYIVCTSALCCFWWENSPESSVSELAPWTKHCVSVVTHQCLWLAIAFIRSTESVWLVIMQRCKNASVSGSAPASELKLEFSGWWFDALNDLITSVIVSNIKMIRLFFVFWKLHSKCTPQKSEGARAPLVSMGMTPLVPSLPRQNDWFVRGIDAIVVSVRSKALPMCCSLCA